MHDATSYRDCTPLAFLLNCASICCTPLGTIIFDGAAMSVALSQLTSPPQ
jgi:hypothetical protein